MEAPPVFDLNGRSTGHHVLISGTPAGSPSGSASSSTSGADSDAPSQCSTVAIPETVRSSQPATDHTGPGSVLSSQRPIVASPVPSTSAQCQAIEQPTTPPPVQRQRTPIPAPPPPVPHSVSSAIPPPPPEVAAVHSVLPNGCAPKACRAPVNPSWFEQVEQDRRMHHSSFSTPAPVSRGAEPVSYRPIVGAPRYSHVPPTPDSDEERRERHSRFEGERPPPEPRRIGDDLVRRKFHGLLQDIAKKTRGTRIYADLVRRAQNYADDLGIVNFRPPEGRPPRVWNPSLEQQNQDLRRQLRELQQSQREFPVFECCG